jgi:hypothetical protein
VTPDAENTVATADPERAVGSQADAGARTAADSGSDEDASPSAAERARERNLRELGPWSSHPVFAPHRIRWSLWITRLPIAFAILILAWMLLSPILLKGVTQLTLADIPEILIGVLTTLAKIPSYGIVAIAATVAASLTAAFTIRAGLFRGHAADPSDPRTDGLRSYAALPIITILCCLLAGWLATTSLLSAVVRAWIVASLLTPAVLLMAYLDLQGIRDAESGLAKVVGALRSAFATIVSLTAVLMISPLSAELGGMIVSWLLEVATALRLGTVASFLQSVIFKDLQQYFAQLVAIAASVAIVLHTSSRASRMAKRVAEEAERDAKRALGQQIDEHADKPKEGCLARIARLIFFWRKRDGDAPESSNGSKVRKPSAEWMQRLESAAKGAKLDLAIEWRRATDGHEADMRYSPEIQEGELDWLFNGQRPSTDQRALLEAFQYRWSEHLHAVKEARYGADRESHADLLVEAEPGSEEQDAVGACAVFAAVARGQRVLMLVPDDLSKGAMVESLVDRLRRFKLDCLYRVDVLTRDSVAKWCPAAGETSISEGGAPPDICVATLADYEHVFYAGVYQSELITSVLLSLEVVIVDRLDLHSLGESGRVHLPFIVDKHRLMLRCDNRAMQLVLTTRPIGKPGPVDPSTGAAHPKSSAARRALAERFFGGDGGLDSRPDPRLEDDPNRRGAHLRYLRTRTTGTPARLWVQAPSNLCDITRRWLAKWLQEKESGPLVVIGLSSKETPAVLRSQFSHRNRTPVCHQLSTLVGDSSPLRGARWVLLAGSPTARQLRSLYGALAKHPLIQLVIVSPEDPDEQRSTEGGPAAAVLPVFPVADSPALFVNHLRSAVPLLRPDMPTRREDFARFGLSWDEERWRLYARALEPRMLQDNWLIELDGGLEELVRSDRVTWPAAFVRHREGIVPHPVDTGSPIPQSLCLLPLGNTLQIGESDKLIDDRRFATWITTRGLELGKSDLAYFRPIMLDSSRHRFRSLSMRQTAHGTIIEAGTVSDDGGDFVVPVRSPSLTIARTVDVDGPFGVRAVNASLFRLRDTEEPCKLRESIVALATIADDGFPSTQRPIQPIEFDVHVGVTVLTVGTALPESDAAARLRDRFEGSWTIADPSKRPAPDGARVYWPALTRVFNYAVSKAAPSLPHFMNAYAFRPSQGEKGATILIIEPAATQGTALHTLRVILDDDSLRKNFIEGMKEAITSNRRLAEGSLVVGDSLEPDEADAAALEAIRRLLREVPDPARRSPFARGGMTGQIRVHEGGEDWATSERRPTEVPDAAHHWVDVNAQKHGRWPPGAKYGLKYSIPEDVVRDARARFGWDPERSEGNPTELEEGCVQLVDAAGGEKHVVPNYGLMASDNAEVLETVARELLNIAEQSGAIGVRDKIGVFASFVQSFKYEASREGSPEDGRWRFGVQLPVVTLHDRSGDCDSLALLLVALLQTVKLARAGIVLVDDPDGGHAMACVAIPAAAQDHVIACGAETFVMIECTSHWPVGTISEEYLGRFGSIDLLARA